MRFERGSTRAQTQAVEALAAAALALAEAMK
jgi:hypothetical protein